MLFCQFIRKGERFMKDNKSTDFWVASNRDMTGLIPSGSADIDELEDYEDLYPMYPSKRTIKSALEKKEQDN